MPPSRWHLTYRLIYIYRPIDLSQRWVLTVSLTYSIIFHIWTTFIMTLTVWVYCVPKYRRSTDRKFWAWQIKSRCTSEQWTLLPWLTPNRRDKCSTYWLTYCILYSHLIQALRYIPTCLNIMLLFVIFLGPVYPIISPLHSHNIAIINHHYYCSYY